MSVTFTLSEFATFIESATNEYSLICLYCVTTDIKYNIDKTYLLEHEGNKYIDFCFFADDNTWHSIPLWVNSPNYDDNGSLLAYQVSINNQETENQETENQETENQETENQETENQETVDVDINAIASQCENLSVNEIMILIRKLTVIADKNAKKENKPVKKQRSEKITATEKTNRVSAKNFGYFELLKSWHNVPTDKIMADKLNSGYSSSVINEDKRVINVLLGTDKNIVIGDEWSDYIINYWEENPDTTWTRLHYAFAKGGRKCQDIGLLCNYVINNGVTQDDIINAIAAQN